FVYRTAAGRRAHRPAGSEANRTPATGPCRRWPVQGVNRMPGPAGRFLWCTVLMLRAGRHNPAWRRDTSPERQRGNIPRWSFGLVGFCLVALILSSGIAPGANGQEAAERDKLRAAYQKGRQLQQQGKPAEAAR